MLWYDVLTKGIIMAIHRFIDQILAAQDRGSDINPIIGRALWSGLDLETIESILNLIN